MKTFLVFVLGLVLGAAGLGFYIAQRAPQLMTNTYASPVGPDETVERLTKAAEADGWKVLGVRKLHESVKKHTGKDVAPVHVVDLCSPEEAGKILAQDDARVVSVFMPCSISVYQTSDGKTWLTAMDAKLLGTLFGGIVKEVMAGPVAEAQAKFIEAATAAK